MHIQTEKRQHHMASSILIWLTATFAIYRKLNAVPSYSHKESSMSRAASSSSSHDRMMGVDPDLTVISARYLIQVFR